MFEGNMIGQTISHYNILEKIGQGGMGVVYKAFDIVLERTVALKFLPSYLISNPTSKKRFFQEAKAAAALNHNNICTIYEIAEADDQIFIAMEYLSGKTLQQLLQEKDSNPLPANQIMDYSAQLCKGLSAAHSQGIVHRDIKSANIFITDDGQVKILDFGLAKRDEVVGLTQSGSTLGTLSYMSPEQINGESADQRSDIWSLGVVLYEMWAGHLPFHGEKIQQIINAVLNSKQNDLRAVRNDIPENIANTINKSISKNPIDRFNSVQELLSDFDRLDNSLFNKKAPLHKRKKVIGIFGLISLSIILFLIFSINNNLNKLIVSDDKLINIAIINFENQTGDPSYDHLQKVIPELLITKLEDSKYFQVTPLERLRGLSKQIGRGDADFIDAELGFELGALDNAAVLALGSFTKAGDSFVTDVKVLDISTRKIIKAASSKGIGEASIILEQIDELVKEISIGMGFSETDIRENDRKISEMTTPSLLAYHYFMLGEEQQAVLNFDKSNFYLKKALELDSTFALPYLFQVVNYIREGKYAESERALNLAKINSNQANEKVQLLIDIVYWRLKDTQKYYNALKQTVRKYPKEKYGHWELSLYYAKRKMLKEALKESELVHNLYPMDKNLINLLSNRYSNIGDFKNALKYNKIYEEFSPGEAYPIDSKAEIYFKMGNIKKAQQMYQKADSLGGESMGAGIKVGYTYLLNEQFDLGEEWIKPAIPDSSADKIIWTGFVQYLMGQYDSCQKTIEPTIQRNAGKDGMWTAFANWINFCLLYERKDYEGAKIYLKNWIDLIIKYPPPNSDYDYLGFFQSQYHLYLGFIEAKAGNFSAARAILSDIASEQKSQNPILLYEWLQNYDYGLLLAMVENQDANYSKAIRIIENYMPRKKELSWDFDVWDMLLYNAPIDRDLKTKMLYSAGKIQESIEEYKKLLTIDLPHTDRRLINPKYHYRLAKIYEEDGQRENAVEEYEKFLDIWKSADEDLPELIDAKKRYANLIKEK